MKRIDPFKIVSRHPYMDADVDLKWYRGASRYNNGATLYGRKYAFRFAISKAKTKVMNASQC